MCLSLLSVVKVDILNASQSDSRQLTFPNHDDDDDNYDNAANADGDDGWKRSVGLIRLSSSNLINRNAPAGIQRRHVTYRVKSKLLTFVPVKSHQILKLFNVMFVTGLSRVVFAAYNNLARWMQPRDTNQSSSLDETGSSEYQVRSRVVSASINEPSGSVRMKKLIEPVEFVLQHANVSVHCRESQKYVYIYSL